MAGTWAQASIIEASVLGIKESVWRNCHVRKVKRAEGLILISVGRIIFIEFQLRILWKMWAFDQMGRRNPRIDRQKICFCIHFRSSNSGKGSIVPVAFQLESMADSPYGLSAPQNLQRIQGGRMAVIQVIVDGVRHLREFRDLSDHSSGGYYLQQWPLDLCDYRFHGKLQHGPRNLPASAPLPSHPYHGEAWNSRGVRIQSSDKSREWGKVNATGLSQMAENLWQYCQFLILPMRFYLRIILCFLYRIPGSNYTRGLAYAVYSLSCLVVTVNKLCITILSRTSCI
jgi:hypothetical protein